MPWMSRLLGPPSETIKSVSDRASALAADQIAGAGTMAPAASPDTDLRKSRRFMGRSNARGIGFGDGIARFVPNLNAGLMQTYPVENARNWLRTWPRTGAASAPLHCIQRNGIA